MEKKHKFRIIATFLSICFFYILVNSQSTYAICQQIGDIAPDFELEELESGEMVRLSDFKGKVVLMTFWATWCPRCWEELDYIKARFEKDDSVVVLLVNMETQSLSPVHVKRIKKKVKEHAIKFPMLLDKRLEVWKAYCVNSLPATVIVGPDGKVVFAEANFYYASREHIEEEIKKYSK